MALLGQLEALQDAFWRHANDARAGWREGRVGAGEQRPTPDLDSQGSSASKISQAGRDNARNALPETAASVSTATQEKLARRYRRSGNPRVPHTWRTRNALFAGMWEEVCPWLAAEPERTAKSLLWALQQRSPGHYADGQWRTLQRRVKE